MSQATTEPIADSLPTPGPWQPNPVLGLVAPVVAAAIAWFIVNQIHPVVPFEDLPELGPYPSAELLAKYKAAEIVFQTNNGAINCSILGALTGFLVGAFTARKRIVGALFGLIAGAVAGGLGGYVAGYLVAGAIYEAKAQSLLQSVGFMTIAWGLIAAVVYGLMAAIHKPSQAPVAAITGIVIAAVGALLYNVVASLLFPMSNLIFITPKTPNERLVWALSFGIAVGIGVAVGFRKSSTKSTTNAVA